MTVEATSSLYFGLLWVRLIQDTTKCSTVQHSAALHHAARNHTHHIPANRRQEPLHQSRYPRLLQVPSNRLAQIDLAQIDLAQIDLAQIDLAKIDLAQIDLAKIDLAKIDLAQIDLP